MRIQKEANKKLKIQQKLASHEGSEYFMQSGVYIIKKANQWVIKRLEEQPKIGILLGLSVLNELYQDHNKIQSIQE